MDDRQVANHPCFVIRAAITAIITSFSGEHCGTLHFPSSTGYNSAPYPAPLPFDLKDIQARHLQTISFQHIRINLIIDSLDLDRYQIQFVQIQLYLYMFFELSLANELSSLREYFAETHSQNCKKYGHYLYSDVDNNF